MIIKENKQTKKHRKYLTAGFYFTSRLNMSTENCAELLKTYSIK